MLYDQGTLAYHLSRPFLLGRDMSNVGLRATVKQLNTFMDADKNAARRPEHDAITFYLTNHAFSTLRMRYDEYDDLGLDEYVAITYFTANLEATIRAFYYLLLICTRESRHVHNSGDFHDKLKAKFGSDIHNFNKHIQGSGSQTAAEALRKETPDVPLGRFTEGLVYTFYKGKFSGGYGGPAWGKVADCLHLFVTGKYSAETMMDTVWTLCHNNGPIFNKGMLYQGHTNDLITILDVQRSGQIPNLIADYVVGHHYIPQPLICSAHVELHNMMLDKFGDAFSAGVDWNLVEKLGSVKKYSHFKNKYTDDTGPVNKTVPKGYYPGVKKESFMGHTKPEPAVVLDHSKWFFVTATQKVKKLTRLELNAKG